MFTHSNETAIGACYLYTFAISKLIQGMDPLEVYDLTKQEAGSNEDLVKYGVEGELTSWFIGIDEGDKPNCTKNIGYLYIAFSWAFKYLKEKVKYQDAIADILSRDGDTDTNAAIVGGLLGAAAQGIDSIPQMWIEKVMSYDPTVKVGKFG